MANQPVKTPEKKPAKTPDQNTTRKEDDEIGTEELDNVSGGVGGSTPVKKPPLPGPGTPLPDM
jgi:hypothetical protein